MKCDRCGMDGIEDMGIHEAVPMYAAECREKQIALLTSERDGLKARVDELAAELRGAKIRSDMNGVRAEAAEAKAKRRLEILRDVERRGPQGWCPDCHVGPEDEGTKDVSEGHDVTCKLAAELKGGAK